MASYPALTLRFVAMAGLATLLSMATPAAAAESVVAAGEPAAAKTMLSIINRHAARKVRTFASDYRRVRSIAGNPYCSVWCGRQFVLMTGIAY